MKNNKYKKYISCGLVIAYIWLAILSFAIIIPGIVSSDIFPLPLIIIWVMLVFFLLCMTLIKIIEYIKAN